MSQTATGGVRSSTNKNTQGPFGVEVTNVQSKQFADVHLLAKKGSLAERITKKLQKESLIQQLVDCLESNKVEIHKLQEIVKYKDKTIKVLQKRHFQVQKSIESLLVLEVLLREKNVTLDQLTVLLKTVSERIQAISKLSGFDKFKTDDQEDIHRTLNSAPLENEANLATTNGIKSQLILNTLDSIEARINKLCKVAHPKLSETVLDLSAIEDMQSSLEQTACNFQFDLANNKRISSQRNQLIKLLKQTEMSRFQLANKVDSEYLRIKTQIKNKNTYPPECLDDITSLVMKTQRQDKRIQESAIELVKVRNDFTEQMRQTLQKIREIQRNHQQILAKKDNQIASLKTKLQIC